MKLKFVQMMTGGYQKTDGCGDYIQDYHLMGLDADGQIWFLERGPVWSKLWQDTEEEPE